MDLTEDKIERLLCLCKEGNIEIITQEFGELGNLECKNKNGWTPLIVAAFHNNYELCRLLIEKGADVNAVNSKGTSVLMFSKSSAIKSGNLIIMDLLIASGANIDHQDNFGKDIFHYLREMENFELIDYLSMKRTSKTL